MREFLCELTFLLVVVISIVFLYVINSILQFCDNHSTRTWAGILCQCRNHELALVESKRHNKHHPLQCHHTAHTWQAISKHLLEKEHGINKTPLVNKHGYEDCLCVDVCGHQCLHYLSSRSYCRAPVRTTSSGTCQQRSVCSSEGAFGYSCGKENRTSQTRPQFLATCTVY